MSRLAKDRLDDMDVGKNIELQGVLDEKLDRVAQVNKTRTITTNKNSLTQSKSFSFYLYIYNGNILGVILIHYLGFRGRNRVMLVVCTPLVQCN